MLKNYFKIAIRNLIRNKGFSFINIFGLAIGMASAILILLWIENEVSHDRFHAKANRIYIANNRDKFDGKEWAWSQTSKPLAPALKQDYPGIEDAVRTNHAAFLLSVGENHLNVHGYLTDPGFLTMFSFPLVAGDAKTALSDNYNIVITQKLAKKLFANNAAIGKVIRIDSTDNFTVSGVLKDLPNNTRFDFEYLLPWAYMTRIGAADSNWGNNSVKTYVLLKPAVNHTNFDTRIQNIVIDHTKDKEKTTAKVFTQPLKDAWLYSKQENGQYVGGRIEIVRLFGIIAAFILLIACINFMNLSTAQSEKRAKEVGIRKVVGAQKSSLIMQFIGESIILAFIAGFIAALLVMLSLPAFNKLMGKELFIDFTQPVYWLFAIAFILFTGLLAGSYPAFYLSSYQPVKVLKGTFKAVNALVTPRKVLVVLQFTFAITLIISTIIVKHQINYAQARDTGYSKDKLVYINIQGEMDKHYDAIKNELLSKGAAVAVTKSMSPITQRYSDGWGFEWPGSTKAEKKVDFIRMASDADFTKTMGVKLLQGRDIDIRDYPADSTAMLLNETAVRTMHLKDPVGQIIKGDGSEWHIVGVIKDFIFESPYEKINELMVMGPKAWFNVIHFKLNTAKPVAENLQIAEKIFKQYKPQYPLDYKFVDDEYAAKFEQEQRTGTFAALFAGLTIFIHALVYLALLHTWQKIVLKKLVFAKF